MNYLKPEFKDPEEGFFKRSIIYGLKSLFLSPIITFYMILIAFCLQISNYFAFTLSGFIIFTINYIHFAKTKNDSTEISYTHYFSTLIHNIKHNNELISRIFFAILVLALFSFVILSAVFFLNPETSETAEIQEPNILSSFSIIFMLFIVISYLFVKYSLLDNIFYYSLMKSNLIFEDFSDQERQFYYHDFETLLSVLKLKNISLVLLFSTTSSSLLVSHFLYIFLSQYFNPLIIYILTTNLFVIFNSGFYFNLTKEIIDGNKEEIKVTELKEVNQF